MTKLIRAGLAALAVGFAPTAAEAVVVFDANESHVINFAGFSDSYAGQVTPVPGLLGQLTLTLTGGLGTNTLAFSYSVLNTSTAPMENSRITFFGFDVAGSGGAAFNFAASEAAGATGLFDGIDSGNIPMGYPDVDICFGTGNGNNCTGGGGNPGASLGQVVPLQGTFSLIFDSNVAGVTLSDLYLRFQSLDSASANLSGASGVGRMVTPPSSPPGGVPEPATWAMLIAGFGLVGASIRRRRTLAHVSQ